MPPLTIADRLRDMQNENRLERKQQVFQPSEIMAPAEVKLRQKSNAPKKKARKNPMTHITKLANEFNALVDLNDQSNDMKFDLDDYNDTNSPRFIDKNDTQSIKEEQNYLQNRIYKMTGDKKYVPDYEDTKQMNDDEFMNFMGDMGMVQDVNGTKVHQIHAKPDKSDKMSDDQFNTALNRLMKQ